MYFVEYLACVLAFVYAAGMRLAAGRQRTEAHSVVQAYLVILQLRSRPLIGIWWLEQPRPAFALQLHHDIADIGDSQTSNNHLATDLVQVGEGYVAWLVKDDGSLHASTAGPGRDNRCLGVVVNHTDGLGVLRLLEETLVRRYR